MIENNANNLDKTNLNFSSIERGFSDRFQKLLLAVSLAAISVLAGCSKPDSLDDCLGEEQAKTHKSRLSRLKNTCHERVQDYVTSNDGDVRASLRNDATHSCESYKDELAVTKALIRAKWDSARRQKQWNKRDRCSTAKTVVENRTNVLEEGDLHDLKTD